MPSDGELTFSMAKRNLTDCRITDAEAWAKWVGGGAILLLSDRIGLEVIGPVVHEAIIETEDPGAVAHDLSGESAVPGPELIQWR